MEASVQGDGGVDVRGRCRAGRGSVPPAAGCGEAGEGARAAVPGGSGRLQGPCTKGSQSSHSPFPPTLSPVAECS